MNPRRLWTLVRREIRTTLRDPATLAMLVAVPLLALVAFGSILSTEIRHLELGVLDGARSETSRRLLAELGTQGRFDVFPYLRRDELEAALVEGAVSVAMVIPPDFDRELRRGGATIQVLYDGGEGVLAGNAEASLEGIVAAVTPKLLGQAEASPPGIRVHTSALFNPTLDGISFMVAGSFGFVLSFLTTMITAVSIVNERLNGTFEQLQVTPATSLEILLGKILPLGAIFSLDVVLMLVLGGLGWGVWPHGSWVFFVVFSTFYVLFSLALGVLISATSASAGEAVQKTVMLSIPIVMLSGFVYPIRSMPTVVQWLTQLFPATHYIAVSRAIYIRAAGPLDVLPEIAILTVFAVLLVVGARRAIEVRA